MEKRELPIVVFDSGVGGISVLRELVKLMPQERFLYFGDSANAPYGTKATSQVRDLTLQNMAGLMARGAKAAVIACNTITSAAIEDLRMAYPQEIIVGIEPAVKLAAELRPHGHILVMATDVTLREHKFEELSARFSGEHPIEAIHCPGLVERVEAGETEGPAMERFLRELLEPHLKENTAAVVLGCTHYPFARKTVQKVVGPDVLVVDGGPGTARETQRRLLAAGLLRTDGPGWVHLESSDPSPRRLKMMEQLLKLE